VNTNDAQTVQQLEQHLLDQLRPLPRSRASLLLQRVDRLAHCPNLGLERQRLIGGCTDAPALIQLATDIAIWTRRAFLNLLDDERCIVAGMLEARHVHVGTRGKDVTGRTTNTLQTPYGRFILD
jgi:hypothetical protein